MLKNSKIFIAGHRGMVGSALIRAFEKKGVHNLILKSSQELDLRDQRKVKDFFYQEEPEIVILAAARVGGIAANIKYPGDFLYENLMIESNVVHASLLTKVKKFCFLGSSCVYPRDCLQPIKEEYLMTGGLEPTNEGYAIAKIAGIKLIELYHRQYGFNGFSIMPCNLYGTNDCYDPLRAHVIPALIRKFVEAKNKDYPLVEIWGTGQARREFMHVDDAAEGILYLIENYDGSEMVNLGPGQDISILNLAKIISRITGFKGIIKWDSEKPDGMPQKCLDVTKMKSLGFYPRIALEDGIKKTIDEYTAPT